MSPRSGVYHRPEGAAHATVPPNHRRRTPLFAYAGNRDAAPRSTGLPGPGLDRRPLTSADLLTLQRTVGNRATAAALQRRSAISPAVIQRQPTITELREFSERYHAIVAALTHGKSIRKYRKKLGELLSLAKKYEFETDLPSMFQQLSALAQLANEKKPDKSKLSAILATTAPQARTGDNAFTSMAAVAFTPELEGGMQEIGADSGGGGFVGNKMRKRARTEATRLGEGHKKGADLEVDVRINLVLAAIDKAYRTHMKRFNARKGGRFDQTLLVFAGPEWYFRRPDRPYTLDEREQVLRAIAMASSLYPEMLIMPGTIIAAEGSPRKPRKGWKNLTNRAFVVWNGNVLKEIDKHYDAGDTKGLAPSTAFQLGKQSTTFNLGDLSFAIDICADHSARRAQKEAENADLHLVTGFGQGPTVQHAATRPGGFLLTADSSGPMFPAQFLQIDKDGDMPQKTEFSGKVLEKDTGHNVGAGKLPLLSYFKTRPFASASRPAPKTTRRGSSDAVPKLIVLDALSGETIETRPLSGSLPNSKEPRTSTQSDELVSSGHHHT